MAHCRNSVLVFVPFGFVLSRFHEDPGLKTVSGIYRTGARPSAVATTTLFAGTREPCGKAGLEPRPSFTGLRWGHPDPFTTGDLFEKLPEIHWKWKNYKLSSEKNHRMLFWIRYKHIIMKNCWDKMVKSLFLNKDVLTNHYKGMTLKDQRAHRIVIF